MTKLPVFVVSKYCHLSELLWVFVQLVDGVASDLLVGFSEAFLTDLSRFWLESACGILA